jgi:hypothetical protein
MGLRVIIFKGIMVILRMLFGLFSPVRINIKIENREFKLGDIITGAIELKVKKLIKVESLQLSLKEHLPFQSSQGTIEFDTTKNRSKNSPKVIAMGVGNNSRQLNKIYEDSRISKIKTMSYRVLIHKEVLSSNKLSPSSSPMVLPIKLKISKDIFEKDELAAKRIIPPQLKSKLDKMTEIIPILLEVKLVLDSGREFTQSVRLRVHRN